MKKLLVLTAIALASLTHAQDRTPSLTGHIEKITGFSSKVLCNQRDILVYLPAEYKAQPKKRFPVLYLADGQNVFDGATSFIPNAEWRADETAEMLIRAKLIQPLIIVGIANMGSERANEYLPIKVKTQSGDEFGGNAKLYGQFLTEELMPALDKQFRISEKPSDTAVGGSSFGGILSLSLGLQYPQKIGKLMAMSPSLWVGNEALTQEFKQLRSKLPCKIWLDMGEREGTDSVAQAKRFYDVLISKGWKAGKDAVYVQEPLAEHNEGAWARRLPSALQYLFPAR